MTTALDFVRAIDQQGHKSKIEIKNWLANRIKHMLVYESDLLWSILYRMDVAEEKIKSVMKNHQTVPVEEGLAQLVLERQIQRNKIRIIYSSSATTANNNSYEIDNETSWNH